MTLCGHFGTCGGCSSQDMPPEAYAASKRGAVLAALVDAGVRADVLAPMIVPPQSRRRAVFKIKSLAEGLHIGFHAAKSHTVVDMHQCEVLTPVLFALVGHLRQALEPVFGVGEGAELHVTETRTGIDAAFRWKRRLHASASGKTIPERRPSSSGFMRGRPISGRSRRAVHTLSGAEPLIESFSRF